MKITKEFDSIVIGAGHAGCEAALALARTGNKTLLLTISLDAIAFSLATLQLAGRQKDNLFRKLMRLVERWELSPTEQQFKSEC